MRIRATRAQKVRQAKSEVSTGNCRLVTYERNEGDSVALRLPQVGIAPKPATLLRKRTPPMSGQAVVEFRPSRVDGVADVVLVRVSARELRLVSAEAERVVRFADIAEQREPRFAFAMHRRPLCIADRDWFHAPPDRFFRFYTKPPLTIFMPLNDAQDWESSCFARIESIIHVEGQFTTADLG